MRIVVLLLTGALSGAVLAAEPIYRPIPIEYVSPGASGSVSTYSRSQSYPLYGGHAVPGLGYGRSQVEIRGGSAVRQSVEYPGGLEVQRYPGQRGYEIRRER
ncbi:hypothetical protein [Pseudomonas paralcaligenes]|uniref:hypothetical protein n=1 Tax=Pseudomonas paralcaligenes TaxID=2772558 RepID=UPI001C7EA5D3|nr:hypothetical protein [Pseudomonas paralcaligenes]